MPGVFEECRLLIDVTEVKSDIDRVDVCDASCTVHKDCS